MNLRMILKGVCYHLGVFQSMLAITFPGFCWVFCKLLLARS
jgi:hypothetical protein